jgi:hypothetical protein
MAHPWSPLRLERPLKFYTSWELEYLVVRRTSIEIKRKTRRMLAPALIRWLPINNSDIRALTLINGGRWLLVVSSAGSVSYYDLEAQKPVKRLLIPAARLESWDDYFPCTAKIAVDMDNESEVLSFNLALYTCKGGNSCLLYNFQSQCDISFIVHRLVHEIRIHLIQVWRVALEPDDQNHRSGLSAMFLSSFPREDYGDVCCLSLLGTSVAFQCIRTTAHSPNRVSDRLGKRATHTIEERHVRVFSPFGVSTIAKCDTSE